MALSADLPEELERFMGGGIERGRYNSKSELLYDALRLKMVKRDLDTDVVGGTTVKSLEEALKDVQAGKTFTPAEVRSSVSE